jgi:hypothetical protein
MKFENLPGIPELWCAFLKGGVPALPFPGTIEGLAACAERVQNHPADPGFVRVLSNGTSEAFQVSENIQRLTRPDAVVVLADIYPGLLGGPVCQVLKCLTAVKVCELLKKNSCNAVPVAWTNNTSPPGYPGSSVSFLDVTADIHSFEYSAAEIIPGPLALLISQIADFGKGSFDPELLKFLSNSFTRKGSLATATARLFSRLMGNLGMIVIDPSDFPRGQAGTESLPVLARVIGPFEIDSLACTPQNLKQPVSCGRTLWPQLSATIGDARSRRTLDRYHLDLSRLYGGEREVLDSLRHEMPSAGLEKLEDLSLEVDARMAELQSYFPEKEFLEASSACREKVLYQIRKLRDLFNAARSVKEQTAVSRIRKAGNLLAPNGRLQERELAGIQIPLKYSLAGLRVVYEKMDILNFEHQLIWMD